MVDLMLGLLSEDSDSISTVIDCQSVTYRDLSIAEVRYVQGKEYCAAYAYYTNTWIAKTPMGPTLRADGTIKMDSIHDVANIKAYESFMQLRRRSWPDRSGLVKVQDSLDSAGFKLVMDTYPFLDGLLYKANFNFSPVPTIQVCLASGKKFKKLLGTLSVDVHGYVSVTSKVSAEMDNIAAMMRGTGRLSLPKELGYE